MPHANLLNVLESESSDYSRIIMRCSSDEETPHFPGEHTASAPYFQCGNCTLVHSLCGDSEGFEGCSAIMALWARLTVQRLPYGGRRSDVIWNYDAYHSGGFSALHITTSFCSLHPYSRRLVGESGEDTDTY